MVSVHFSVQFSGQIIDGVVASLHILVGALNVFDFFYFLFYQSFGRFHVHFDFLAMTFPRFNRFRKIRPHGGHGKSGLGQIVIVLDGLHPCDLCREADGSVVVSPNFCFGFFTL